MSPLPQTSVRRSPDLGRIGKAVARPGIDPTQWVSLAVVTAVNIDPDHGPLVDVDFLPGPGSGTARCGAAYAGDGFGLYAPLEVGDEVCVVAPDGDPAAGLVVVARLWSGGDPPPADAAVHPDDVLLLAKPGATVRVVVAGSGDVVVDPRGSGKVKLGAETGTVAAAKAPSVEAELSALQVNLAALVAAFIAHVHPGKPPTDPADFTGVTATPVTPPGPVGSVGASKVEVK